jgi:xylulokinase
MSLTGALFIGVDIGTQGVKAAAYDVDGQCFGEAFRKSELLHPAPGAVEEDPERQVRSTCEVIAECAARAQGRGTVRALAIDGQMAGIIGVGEDGKHVTPYDSWLDTRCAPWIERMQAEAGAEIVRGAGGPPSFNHGPKILWWKNERAENYKKIRSFVQPGGYAAMRLCGLDGSRAFIDTSYLHFSGFADTRAAVWDRGLCRRFGVDATVLPRIVASHDVIGQVVPAMAAACGLAAGVPVVAGCGDTAASFLSCGATRTGICVDVAGTASVFAATTSEFRADEKSMVLSCGRSAVPGLWHPYAYINGGGLNLEWFREQIAGGLRGAGAGAAAGRTPAAPDFDLLNEMASAVIPADDDPMFIPHLGGRVSPSQPKLRGAWVGLSWSHGPGHLFRAILEGVALEYGIYLRRLGDLFGASAVAEVRVTGGGEKSAAWNSIKADTLGVPVRQVLGAGGAPLGSALLAGYGEGTLRDIEGVAARWVRTGAVTEPDPVRVTAGRKRIARYAALLESLNSWASEGEHTPWQNT